MTARDLESPWTIELSRERLTEFAADPAFHALMQLARHVNALRFAQVALKHADEQEDGPVSFRARPSAFFYMGSVLVEALGLIPTLRSHFESNPHWTRSFGRFGADDAVRALYAQGTDLHRLRNHIGSHVRHIVPERSLPTLDLPDYVVVRGVGKQVGNIYYELADSIALHYLFDSPKTFSGLLTEFEARGAAITKVLVDFLEAADILIPRVLEQWKARLDRRRGNDPIVVRPTAVNRSAAQMVEELAAVEKEKRAKSVAKWANIVVCLLGVVSASLVGWELHANAALPTRWLTYLAVFLAVAAVPQLFVEALARLAESVAPEIPDRAITRGFRNLGAWVGVLERPLLLGALLTGIPEFVGGWYVLKGIAGYSLGLQKKDLAERRSFQLFLINNAASLFGVAFAWLVWRLLGFPVP